MNAEAVLAWLDTFIPAHTGETLSELERIIVQQVWLGRKYLEIANQYGCTEGHAKDVGSRLWKLLSLALKQKITKGNCRSILERCFRKAATLSGLRPVAISVAPVENNLDNTDQYIETEYIESECINFLGRGEAIAHLQVLKNQGAKVIVIQGEGGLGKTTLAIEYLHREFDLVLELLMAKETQNITAAEHVVSEWLKQDFNEEPGVEFGVSLQRLKRQLHGRKIGVLIDNIESALDGQGRFIEAHRNYVELLRVLSDTRVDSTTVITSRDRLCEPSLNVEHYRLPGLEKSAWLKFFQNREVEIDLPTLEDMQRAYGGNAKAMGILCGTIQEDFAGDMARYWQENRADPLAVTDLKNLVASQIDRLQSLDLSAYRLLCRLSCYRYQDVAKISTPGVYSLLWDIPATQHRQIITSLRNRSLIEYHQGEYCLHPVIRAEAISRLRASEDWEVTNHKAAAFWNDSIQQITAFKDAIQALEAYYHYIEINQFELAGKVILKSRNNQWRQYLPLGSILYRIGWVQPLISLINQVIYNINIETCHSELREESHNCHSELREESHHEKYKNVTYHYNLSELYNILGDLYWITGKINFAIECQQKTIQLATQNLKSLVPQPENKHNIYYLRMLEVDSLLSIGLYQLDLWELEASSKLFQQVIDKAQNTDHHRWAEKASVCLALVNSYLGFHEKAHALVKSASQAIISQEQTEHTGRYAYFIQMLGQTYVNLGDFVQANQMFTTALDFAETSHYTQVKAKSLSGLAQVYRQQSQFELALTYHSQAIELLDKIGAKCDLAVAYFQLGLTYQKMQSSLSQEAFNFAIDIFTQMQAPKQVERVFKKI
jgi:tetratricopeptide (TPR) repeat protein